VVHHHPSVHRDSVSRRWHIVRNALWCAWLRRPLASAARKTWRSIQEAPLERATWRGLATALVGLPWVLRRRRVIPRQVEKAVQMLERSDQA
jgi:hypothetical protein